MMTDLQVGAIACDLAARRPGRSLPGSLYRDPASFQFDLDAIFYSQWLFAGLEAEISRPGDYFTLEIGPSSVIVLRDKAGKIRAFHNSCRHRGSRICTPGRGRSSSLVCPYHHWTYGLDGSLVQARLMPAEFDKSQHGLKPVKIESMSGILYICLSDDPPNFSDYRAKAEPLLAPHNLAEAKVAAQTTIMEQGNWKLVMENSRECYHCKACHPELMTSLLDFYDLDSSETKAFWSASEAKGLKNGPVYLPGGRVVRLPLAPGAVSVTMDGKPAVAKLLGDTPDDDIGSLRVQWSPNSFCHIFGDYAFFFRLLPRGPLETEVTSTFLVHKDAVEGVDYDVDKLTSAWIVTNDQDRGLVEVNQLGVNSVGYQPGPYNPTTEPGVLSFVDWYVQAATGYILRNGFALAKAAE